MDKTDRKILVQLQQNARQSVKEISAVVGLSLPTVSERIRKLEQGGVIKGYTALLDHEKFGQQFCCFCLLILRGSETNFDSEFMAYMRGNPRILECHRLLGNYEYLLKVVTSSVRDLEALLCHLRDDWGILKSSTYTVLNTIKEEASLGAQAGLE